MQNIVIVRAVGAEFISRKFKSILTVYLLVSSLVIGILIWIVNVSIWWWLVAAPVTVLIILGLILFLFARLVVRVFSPALTMDQHSGVASFVDKLERVAEQVQTPPYIIFFYIVKDIVRPRGKTYIAKVIHDSTSLRPDYAALQKLFFNVKI